MYLRTLWGKAWSSVSGVTGVLVHRSTREPSWLDPQISADTNGNVRVSHITHIVAVLLGVSPRQTKTMRTATLHLYEHVNPLVWDSLQHWIKQITVVGLTAADATLAESPLRMIELLSERIELPTDASIVFQGGACLITAPAAAGAARNSQLPPPRHPRHPRHPPPPRPLSLASGPTRFILATVLQGGGHIVMAREKTLCPLP
jgi:hypothetical protein